jgi:hypothetical protein
MRARRRIIREKRLLCLNGFLRDIHYHQWPGNRQNNNPYKAFTAEGAEERGGKSKGKDSKRSPFWRREFSIPVRFSANLCVLYGEVAVCRIIEP